MQLYTKAYTLLSSAPPPHSRLALHFAHRLALAYSRAGKGELSRRFWERLGRGYEREGWGVGASGLLGHEVRKERGLGGEGTLESLWEGIGDGRESSLPPPFATAGRHSLTSAPSRALAGVTQDELLAFIKETDPPSSEPVVVASAPSAPVFDVSSAFYLPRAYTLSEVPFQLHLSLPERVVLDQLTFSAARVELSDGNEVVVEHVDGGETQGGGLRVVKVGASKEGKASLVWPKGGQGLVVSGWTSSETPGQVSVSAFSSLRSEDPSPDTYLRSPYPDHQRHPATQGRRVDPRVPPRPQLDARQAAAARAALARVGRPGLVRRAAGLRALLHQVRSCLRSSGPLPADARSLVFTLGRPRSQRRLPTAHPRGRHHPPGAGLPRGGLPRLDHDRQQGLAGAGRLARRPDPPFGGPRSSVAFCPTCVRDARDPDPPSFAPSQTTSSRSATSRRPRSSPRSSSARSSLQPRSGARCRSGPRA